MALANGGYLHFTTYRNSCKFFTESDKKKLAMVISKIQVSDLGPSWPSCFVIRILLFLSFLCSTMKENFNLLGFIFGLEISILFNISLMSLPSCVEYVVGNKDCRS